MLGLASARPNLQASALTVSRAARCAVGVVRCSAAWKDRAQIVDGGLHDVDIVVEAAKPAIAAGAEQAAHHPGVVVVIDVGRAHEPLAADGAGAALICQDRIEIRERKPVSALQFPLALLGLVAVETALPILGTVA